LFYLHMARRDAHKELAKKAKPEPRKKPAGKGAPPPSPKTPGGGPPGTKRKPSGALSLDECRKIVDEHDAEVKKDVAKAKNISKAVKAAQRRHPLVMARDNSIDELEKIPNKRYTKTEDEAKKKKAVAIINKYKPRIKSLYESLNKELAKL